MNKGKRKFYELDGVMMSVPQLAKISIAPLETLRNWISNGMAPAEAVKRVPKDMGPSMKPATDREAWGGLNDAQREELRKMQNLCDRTRWT